MKLTFLFLMIGLMHVSASVYSQSTKLTLELRNKKVVEVLDEIEKQSEFRFAYSSELIDVNRKVSVNINDKKIEKTLDVIFEGTGVSYALHDRHIMLYPKEMGEVSMVAQQNSISGKVTDEQGLPLPGVTVIIKGTTNGTVTNLDGNYILSNIPDEATLQFSFVGMLTQEVVIANQTSINISMVADAIGIEEVVAIGYGTSKKGELTSSISSISNELIEKQPVQYITQAMQGQVAGVQITNTSGRPGDAPKIRVRGSSTINNNDPLYIIDGMQTSSIQGINPSDIESVSVLKDAGAAIYGAQAANGVVIITTKKGKSGIPTVSLDLSYGFKETTRLPEMTNTEQFARSYNASRENAGLAPYWDLNNLPPHNTDWLNQVYGTGTVTNNSVKVSGGNEHTTYLVGLNYMGDEGIVKNSGFDRYNFRLNTDTKISKKFSIGNTFSLSHETTEISGGNGATDEILITVMRAAPTVPVKWTEWDTENNPLFDSRGWNVGDYAGPSRAGEHPGTKNPVGFIEDKIHNGENKELRALGAFYAEYRPIEGLRIRSQFSGDYINNTEIFFNKAYSYGTKSISSDPYSKRKSTGFNYSFDNQIEYTKSIGLHNFKALAGMSARKNFSEWLGVEMLDFIDPDLNVVDAGGTVNGVSGNNYTDSWVSYFGRLNYDYKGNYLLQAIFRADGSSKFGANNSFGYFPSFSGAWRISNEEFFDVKIIDNLKLRASWGQTGNDRIARFQTVEVLDFNYSVFGANQNMVTGVYPSVIANENLKWETVVISDIGVDIGLMDNKLNIVVDWFKKDTKDMLLRKPISPSSGYSQNPYYNAGSMETKGWDFEVSYANNKNGWDYRIAANASTYTNKVTSLGADNELFGSFSKTEVGQPIGYFYGLKTDGLFQSQAEVDAYSLNGELIQPHALPGDIRFVDMDGDGSITSTDRTKIGNPFPDLIFGFNFYVEKSGFDLNVSASGTLGNNIYRAQSWGGFENIVGRANLFSWVADYWTEENKHNDVRKPRPNWLSPNGNFQTSDRYVSSGSYLRLNSVQLGYTLKRAWVETIGFDNARFYLSGTNLLTITNYEGFDPEVGGGNLYNSYGIDNDSSYPPSRGLIFGVQLSF